jgi:hypothetical protein
MLESFDTSPKTSSATARIVWMINPPMLTAVACLYVR